MRKLVASGMLMATLVLTGCFSGSTTAELPPNQMRLVADDFELIYPIDWEVLKKNDFPPGIPPETRVAIRTNLKDKRFIPNVTVVQNTIPEGTSAAQYGTQVYQEHKGRLLNFNEENFEQITTLVAGQETPSVYLIFTGKLDAKRDTLRYVQKFATKGTNGYIITITTPLQEDPLIIEKTRDIMRSFIVK